MSTAGGRDTRGEESVDINISHIFCTTKHTEYEYIQLQIYNCNKISRIGGNRVEDVEDVER